MKSVVTGSTYKEDPDSFSHLRIAKNTEGAMKNLVVMTDLYTEKPDTFRATVIGCAISDRPQTVTLRIGLQSTFSKKDFERFYGKVELSSEV